MLLFYVALGLFRLRLKVSYLGNVLNAMEQGGAELKKILVLILMFLCPLVQAETIKFPLSAMQPTIKMGDSIRIDRNYYEKNSLVRGDIVVVDIEEGNKINPSTKKLEIVKRVVALEGDLVEVSGKSLLINSKPVVENYAIWKNGGKINFKSSLVPKGTVFILGDNRDDSRDSRMYDNPFIPLENIKGKVFIESD